MDTQKVLAIINDVLQEHEAKTISATLTEMRTRVAENTSAAFQLALEQKAKLDTAFGASTTNEYTPSDTRLLDEIGGDGFVGISAKAKVAHLFSSNSFDLLTQLDKYIADYVAFIDKITRLKSSLESIGVEPYLREDFEIGLTIPTELNDLQDVVKKLNIWDRFLVTSSEIAGHEGESKTTQLARVDNGSLQFFVPKDHNVAYIVDFVLAQAYTLYMAIKKIQRAQLEVENLEIDQDIKKKLRAQYKEAEKKKRADSVASVSDEVFERLYKGKPERKEELQSQFGTFFKLILKFIQQGIEPEVASPSKTDENVPAETASEITAHTQDLKKLYSEPVEQRLLAFDAKVTDKEVEEVTTEARHDADEENAAPKTMKASEQASGPQTPDSTSTKDSQPQAEDPAHPDASAV